MNTTTHRWDEPAADEDGRQAEVDRLAQRFKEGDADALLALRTLLGREVSGSLLRARFRLSQAPSLETGDVQQEVWLALAEAARIWEPARDGPFLLVARRAVRRQLVRCLRRNSARRQRRAIVGLEADGELPYDPPDPAPTADPARWVDLLLARQVAAALPQQERRALVLRGVEERPLTAVAGELGISRRAATSLLARARLYGRALAGAAPPPQSLASRVLAAAQAGAERPGGRVPTTAWLVARTGLGRRRVKATLRELAVLGYLRRSRLRWHLERLAREAAETGDG